MIEIPNHIISTITSILEPYRDFTPNDISKMLNAPQKPLETISERYYTRKELAERLNLSTLTIDRAISDKKLKRYKIGKKVLISDLQVNEWLRRNTR